MADFPKDLETLKPLLLKLLNEQIPASIKEMAEQVLNRITAQQILSQENGPIQNLLLTLPINLGSTQTDLTLQWSGRKTKDGKIDPDYCRVLFYLELERLKETVIDMQGSKPDHKSDVHQWAWLRSLKRQPVNILTS